MKLKKTCCNFSKLQRVYVELTHKKTHLGNNLSTWIFSSKNTRKLWNGTETFVGPKCRPKCFIFCFFLAFLFLFLFQNVEVCEMLSFVFGRIFYVSIFRLLSAFLIFSEKVKSFEREHTAFRDMWIFFCIILMWWWEWK